MENQPNTSGESNWDKRLDEIRQKKENIEQTKNENSEKVRHWVEKTLWPAFVKLESKLSGKQNIEEVEKKYSDEKATLRFKDAGTPFQYTIVLNISPEGIKGQTKMSKGYMNLNKIYESMQEDILNWQEDDILEDFLSGYAKA